MSQANKPHSESKATTVVAWGVILFGIVLGIAFILSYGQVETRNDNLTLFKSGLKKWLQSVFSLYLMDYYLVTYF